jgi:transcriptional regulator with XRE-family HTH domain
LQYEVKLTEKFPTKLRELIERFGGQVRFGDRCGLSQSLLSMYSTGERSPSAENVLKIANAGKVSLYWLLGADLKDLPLPLRETEGDHRDGGIPRFIGAIDVALLAEILNELRLTREWKKLSPRARAAWAGEVYELYLEKPVSTPKRPVILKLNKDGRR